MLSAVAVILSLLVGCNLHHLRLILVGVGAFKSISSFLSLPPSLGGYYRLNQSINVLREFKYTQTETVNYSCLSYDFASGSEITPCNKICKPLVVYRISETLLRP